MKRLVLDAGPLIALFRAEDTRHQDSINGFQQLAQQNTILLTPIPIIFEVYKWLLRRTRPEIAQNTLKVMQESLHPFPLGQSDFSSTTSVARFIGRWNCSGSDASSKYHPFSHSRHFQRCTGDGKLHRFNSFSRG